jgi:primosomal protein N'
MRLVIENYNIRELYCPSCGKISETPICCTIEMEVDSEIFFCTICGKEKKLPFCCSKMMQIREKKVKV